MPRGRKRKFPISTENTDQLDIINLTQDSHMQQQPPNKVPKVMKKSAPAPGPSTSKMFQVTKPHLQQHQQSQSSSTRSSDKVSTTKISLNLNSSPQGLSDDMKSTMEQLLLFIQQDETSLAEPSHDVDGAVEVSSSTGELLPPHSLSAFGSFLSLPGYSEVLVDDPRSARCLLRLALGFRDDGEGVDILSSPIAASLPTLPFLVLKELLDRSSATTSYGLALRTTAIEIGAIEQLLNCLSVLCTNECSSKENSSGMSGQSGDHTAENSRQSRGRGQGIYKGSTSKRAKGTGYSSSFTTNQSSWDVKQSLIRQSSEQDYITAVLQVLASYIGTGEQADKELPSEFYNLLSHSCLLPALSAFLRNNSILEMAQHLPLYRAVLLLLRTILNSSQLAPLLLPKDDNESSIVSLLTSMWKSVDTYVNRINRTKNIAEASASSNNSNVSDQYEGLAALIPDIQEITAVIASYASSMTACTSKDSAKSSKSGPKAPLKSIEQRYKEVMKNLQFDTFEFTKENPGGGFNFAVSYHYENTLRAAGENCHPGRMKRLAQEAVTLSTALPLSYSSSVFVRCDTDRLDMMKVLITGQDNTPYANGCFEFDVYFPTDYPNSPLKMNLETTGRKSIRFNPNLYNDGKVCLSLLNTWDGSPEEKWNSQTSTTLQALVSIQSMILNSEPYFNEPGRESSQGAPSATQASVRYNDNIRQATVQWAMLDQIRNPCPCFKEVIHTHFWLKRNQIVAQIDNWLKDMNGISSQTYASMLKTHYKSLKEELNKLPTPKGLEDLAISLDSSSEYQ